MMEVLSWAGMVAANVGALAAGHGLYNPIDKPQEVRIPAMRQELQSRGVEHETFFCPSLCFPWVEF